MADPPTDVRLPRPYLDPTRHLLTRPHYEQHPDGSEALRPIPLDEAAATWRSRLGETIPQHPDPAIRVVRLEPGRASVIGALITELSLRLQPGLAVGPIESDGSLSRLAQELADDLDRRIR